MAVYNYREEKKKPKVSPFVNGGTSSSNKEASLNNRKKMSLDDFTSIDSLNASEQTIIDMNNFWDEVKQKDNENSCRERTDSRNRKSRRDV